MTNINFNSSPVVDNYCLGNVNDSSKNITITPPVSMTKQNPSYYRVEFYIDNKTVTSEKIEPSNQLTFSAWEQLTKGEASYILSWQPAKIGIQLEAYDSSDKLIAESYVVPGLYFLKSSSASSSDSSGGNGNNSGLGFDITASASLTGATEFPTTYDESTQWTINTNLSIDELLLKVKSGTFIPYANVMIATSMEVDSETIVMHASNKLVYDGSQIWPKSMFDAEMSAQMSSDAIAINWSTILSKGSTNNVTSFYQCYSFMMLIWADLNGNISYMTSKIS